MKIMEDLVLSKMIRYGLIDFKMRKTRAALERGAATLKTSIPEVIKYDQALRPHRDRLAQTVRDLILRIDGYGAQRDQMIYLTLISFSSIGAKMVESAEYWLRTWSGQLLAQGYNELGESYRHHADEEVGHDVWHRRDVGALAEMYRSRFGGRINTDKVLNMGNSPCVGAYRHLSESEISGPSTILSLAELYETEIMALELAPNFIRYCVGELGFGILKGLGFLRGHVIADADHIRENIEQLNTLLANEPQRLHELIEVGIQTNQIYADYFKELVAMADQLLREHYPTIERSA